MKRIENFLYNDIVLYAKGWYRSKGNETWKDLAYFFGEIYAWTPQCESEVSLLMLKILEKLYIEFELDRNPEKICGKWYASPFTLEQEIRKTMIFYNCNRDNATIIVVLEVLMNMSNDEIKLNKPVYSKKNPFRLGGAFTNYPVSMTYSEMNRIASKYFDNNKKNK